MIGRSTNVLSSGLLGTSRRGTFTRRGGQLRLRNNAIAALLDEQCRDPSTIFMEAVHNLTVYLGGAVTRSCQ